MACGRLLRAVDYLSTVSGGGYIGCFLGALFVRGGEFAKEQAKAAKVKQRIDVQPIVHAEEFLGNNDSLMIGWLRENGRHLAPNGAGDLITAVAVQLRNWLSVVLVMGVSLLTVFLGAHVLWLGIDCVREWSFLAGKVAIPKEGEISWWTPWLVPTLGAAAMSVAFDWGYWLISSPSDKAGMRYSSKLAVLFALIVSCWLGLNIPNLDALFSWQKIGPVLEPDYANIFQVVLALGLLTLLFFGVMWQVGRISLKDERLKQEREVGPGPTGREEKQELARRLRNRYAANLKLWLVVTACLLAFALIDSFGQSLYLASKRAPGWPTALKAVWSASALALIFSFGDKLSTWIGRFSGGKKARPSLELIALVAGIVGVLLFLLNCNVLAHACAWGFKDPALEACHDRRFFWIMLLGSAVLAYLFGRNLPFLNASSVQYLYGARLVRAYLGATNPHRYFPRQVAVTDTIAGDDSSLAEYVPFEKGGAASYHQRHVQRNMLGQISARATRPKRSSHCHRPGRPECRRSVPCTMERGRERSPRLGHHSKSGGRSQQGFPDVSAFHSNDRPTAGSASHAGTLDRHFRRSRRHRHGTEHVAGVQLAGRLGQRTSGLLVGQLRQATGTSQERGCSRQDRLGRARVQCVVPGAVLSSG
jgi:hypothetical protein